MLDLICDEWQNKINCDTNRKEFKMRTTNNLNHIERFGADGNLCVLFENKKAQMIDGGAFYRYNFENKSFKRQSMFRASVNC